MQQTINAREGTLTATMPIQRDLSNAGCMSKEQRVETILSIIDANRRTERCASECWAQKEHWRHKIENLVDLGEPIELVMPAFPCKSPNRETKVLGTLPDAGEALALQNLSSMAEAIHAVSPGGARVVLVADGYVFGDLVRVNDATISAYLSELRALNPNPDLVKIISLQDFFPEQLGFGAQRVALEKAFGPSCDEVRYRIEHDASTNSTYRGMKCFLTEDIGAAIRAESEGISKNGVNRICGETAAKMILRNEAFHAAIRQRFPNCVRCSVHPQPDDSKEKIGVALINRGDGWGTPWHGVLVATDIDRSVRPRIMKRIDAERSGHALVFNRDSRRPWAFAEKEPN
ncbi:MAG: isocyanide synthase family protein [Deltaproteobacteria bacterium]|nr:isocyanide synthase family protein [Deltaproteobacteria bacterium]